MATSSSNELPDHRKRNTFTSYVAPQPGDLSVTPGSDEWCLSTDMRDVHQAKPRLLAKELIVASAPAYMYSAIAPIDSELKRPTAKEAIFGLLSVTNFKLAFVPLHCQLNTNHQQKTECYQEQQYLQRNEVTLNNIDHIYTMAEAGRTASALNVVGSKRKKLESQQKVVSGRIAALHIVCKNFRLLKFAFQQQDTKTDLSRDDGKMIACALARFAYPARHDLSFAYCYLEPYYSTLAKTGVTMYTTQNDWARELIRCGANDWQVVSTSMIPLLQKKAHASKYTLPPHFVIPKCCDIGTFLNWSLAHNDSRAAFWVYSFGCASLVRLAECHSQTSEDSFMLEKVRTSNKNIELFVLTKWLPTVQEVQRAYLKFRRLCTPETPQQFLLLDAKFLTLLEKSNWLLFVSQCLGCACRAAKYMRKSTSCALQDVNGRDLCCIISSLTQIILDPMYRTIDGFQSLIQKEWVALEHPFQTRLGHVRNASVEPADEESPVFLLFLDCVWQLLQQFPDEFEYSQTYLTTLWDSCFLPIFDTFQFDTEADRARAVQDGKLVLRPVWDWSEQFADKDKVFFTNPLFQRQRIDYQHQHQQQMFKRSIALATTRMNKNHQQLQQQQHIQTTQQRYTINPELFVTQSSISYDRFLEPQHAMCDLAVWEQCYYRWLPVLEIQQGGSPQIDIYHRLLLSNIAKLQRCIDLQEYDDLPDIYYELTGEVRTNEANENDPRTTATSNIEYIDGVERRQKSLTLTKENTTPSNGIVVARDSNNARLLTSISSFFPFGANIGETPQQLLHILTNSGDFLLEGSILDRLSIA